MATFIFSRGNIFFYVNKITIPDLMSDVLLSKLSTELADLDGEIGQIDQQISQLRRKKSELTQKRQAVSDRSQPAKCL